MSDVILETAREWRSGIPNADHSLISVQITSEEAPWIGKGRWRIPDYKTFKKQLVNKAKDWAKQIEPGLTRKINEHQLELERVLNDQEMLEQAKMTKSKEIKTEITHLEKMRIHKTQRNSQTHHVIERELPSHYMSQISKEKKPRDMLYALRKPNIPENNSGNIPGNTYEKNSKKMAELAKNYHSDLQELGIDANREAERNVAINETLDQIRTMVDDAQ
ncbi:hypothetical protein DFJ43DRAFT_1040999 [Lentinula guzmanii]|uniref:Uncharacterized protein n=1 Tax=Lentinula guzmanii TaxID=2804957 RepID=A0AA38MYG7_9AGAR|nr:hypothetical protein DFJ43DRAFT_1040999 [Lentinula guzmanii]